MNKYWKVAGLGFTKSLVCLALFTAPQVWAQLDFIGVVRDGVAGVDGLEGAEKVTVSRDGAHVYATGILDNAVAAFARDSMTGMLTFLEVERDGVGGVDGTMGAQGVIVTRDDRHVLVTGSTDDALAVFSRDTSTGLLTFLEVHRNGIAGVSGLAGPLRLKEVGTHIYVTATVDNAIAIFSRDAVSGSLTFVGEVREGIGGVDGITGILDVISSPDERFLYATGSGEDALAVFRRQNNSGLLTQIQVLRDGIMGSEGLGSPQEMAFNPNGMYLFVTAFAENSLASFSRDPSTGMLAFESVVRDGVGGADGLSGALGIAVKPASKRLFTTGFNDSAVAVFRGIGPGPMFDIAYFDGMAGIDGLAGAVGLAWDPTGTHLYATGFSDNAIAIFEMTTTLPDLISNWGDLSTTVLDIVSFLSAP